MPLSRPFLDGPKGRRCLSEVIGRAVNLKRQGREWVGLSPFAEEKTPSFFVKADKGFWRDVSSGKRGDPISFLRGKERLSFRGTMERLAGDAGFAMPADGRGRRRPRRATPAFATGGRRRRFDSRRSFAARLARRRAPISTDEAWAKPAAPASAWATRRAAARR